MTSKPKEMTELEEREYIDDFEASSNPIVSVLTPERRREMAARATINDQRRTFQGIATHSKR